MERSCFSSTMLHFPGLVSDNFFVVSLEMIDTSLFQLVSSIVVDLQTCLYI
jgi:hypothetical protein